MRTLTLAVLNMLLMVTLAVAQQAKPTFPLVQKMTLQEFIKFGKVKGSDIEPYRSSMTVTLSKSIYPFIDDYKLAQPVHGSWISDSTKVSFECFFTKADSIVKYVSYNLGPDKPSLQDVFQQLLREGKTSQEEINKAIELTENDPRSSQKNTAIYQRLRNYFYNQLGEPVTFSNDKAVVLHHRLSWQKDNLHVLLAYKGKNREKSDVILRTYWE